MKSVKIMSALIAGAIMMGCSSKDVPNECEEFANDPELQSEINRGYIIHERPWDVLSKMRKYLGDHGWSPVAKIVWDSDVKKGENTRECGYFVMWEKDGDEIYDQATQNFTLAQWSFKYRRPYEKIIDGLKIIHKKKFAKDMEDPKRNSLHFSVDLMSSGDSKINL